MTNGFNALKIVFFLRWQKRYKRHAAFPLVVILSRQTTSIASP
jgi:hypothetical protein